MIFGPTPLDEARGAVLAHTVRLQGRVLKKGTVLDQAAIAALQQGGHGSVIAARLEPGDVPEDEAADRLANALMGPLLARSRASTGRVNLLAETPGLLVVEAETINRLNALDESLTVPPPASLTPVSPREMRRPSRSSPSPFPARCCRWP